MRVGVVADTHGSLSPRVLEALAGCAAVVHAGDVGDERVLDALAALGGALVAVRGNNDVPAKLARGARSAVATLPLEAGLDLPGGRLEVVHGDRVLPARDRHRKLRARFPAARMVVYGHSHRMCIDRDDEPWIVNPGAAGRARAFGGPGLLLLEARSDDWDLEARRFPPEPGTRRSARGAASAARHRGG